MKMLEDAGIYVLAVSVYCYLSLSDVTDMLQALGSSRWTINRMEPHTSYTEGLLSHLFTTADVLAMYPNCLGVLAGHEIINNQRSLKAVPVVRAVVRDLKRYLRLKHDLNGQRVLPVGYSTADVRNLEPFIRDYLSAGEELSKIDFWAVSRNTGKDSQTSDANEKQKSDYSWCSPANMQTSGYDHQV